MIDHATGTFSNGSPDRTITLADLRATEEKLAALGRVAGPWTVARDVWDALTELDARTADVYLDARLPPGTYYEGKPGAPRL